MGGGKTIMTCATVWYVTVISVLLRIAASVLPTCDWPRVQWASFLEKINSHYAEVHSTDHAKGLQCQQNEAIAQADLVAPLQSETQIHCNLHCDSPEKHINPSYNRCLSHECHILQLILCLFFRHVQRTVSTFLIEWLHLLLAYSCLTCTAILHTWCRL